MSETNWAGQQWSKDTSKTYDHNPGAQTFDEAVKPSSVGEKLDFQAEKLLAKIDDVGVNLGDVNNIAAQKKQEAENALQAAEAARAVLESQKAYAEHLKADLDQAQATVVEKRNDFDSVQNQLGAQESAVQGLTTREKLLKTRLRVLLEADVKKAELIAKFDKSKNASLNEAIGWKRKNVAEKTKIEQTLLEEAENNAREQVYQAMVLSSNDTINFQDELSAKMEEYDQLVEKFASKNAIQDELSRIGQEQATLEAWRKDLEKAQQIVDSAQLRATALQTELQRIVGEQKRLGKEFTAAEKEASQARGEQSTVEAQIVDKETQLDKLREELAQAEAQYRVHMLSLRREFLGTGVGNFEGQMQARMLSETVHVITEPGAKDVEKVAYQLGREWRFAQKGKTNEDLMVEESPAENPLVTGIASEVNVEFRLDDSDRVSEQALKDLLEISKAVAQRAMDARDAATSVASERTRLISDKQNELEQLAVVDLEAFMRFETESKMNFLTPGKYEEEKGKISNRLNSDEMNEYRSTISRSEARIALLEQNSLLAAKSAAEIARLKKAVKDAKQNIREAQSRVKADLRVLDKRFKVDQEYSTQIRTEKSQELAEEVSRKLEEYKEVVATSTKGLERFTQSERELILSAKVDAQLAEVEQVADQVKKWESVFGLSIDSESKEAAKQHLLLLVEEMVRHELALQNKNNELTQLQEQKTQLDAQFEELDAQRQKRITVEMKATLDEVAGATKRRSIEIGKKMTRLRKEIQAENDAYPNKIAELQMTLLPADLLQVDGVVKGMDFGENPATSLGRLAELTLYGGSLVREENDGSRVPREQVSIFESFGGMKTLEDSLGELRQEVLSAETKKAKEKQERESRKEFAEKALGAAETGLDEAINLLSDPSITKEQVAKSMRSLSTEKSMLFITRMMGSGKLPEMLQQLSSSSVETDQVRYAKLAIALDAVGQKLIKSSDKDVKAFFRKNKGLRQEVRNWHSDAENLRSE